MCSDAAYVSSPLFQDAAQKYRSGYLNVTPRVFCRLALALALAELRPTLSIDPCGQGIEPRVGSWPDLAFTNETVAGDSYSYLLPEGKRNQTRIGVLCCTMG
jgi:hypothetical protein